MFVITPIQDKALQAHYCQICKIPYLPHTMAYQAILNDEFAAICQFELKKDYGYIHHLCPLPGVEDFEMMFIMGRSVMNFIDLCEHHVCKANVAAADKILLEAIGFRLIDDEYVANMHGMFGGCGGSCQKD